MGNGLERERTGDNASGRNEIDRQLVPRRAPSPPATGGDLTAVHRSSSTMAVVTDDGIAVLRRERIVIVSSTTGERPQLRRAEGCESKCSYDKYGKESVLQEWYQCHTCWGGESSYGCCKYCAATCHRGHKLVSRENVGGFCDCGVNCHKAAVCTYHSTRKEYTRQPFYRCYSCFTLPNEGCCFQCVKNCHAGHLVGFAGILPKAFCDCGLSGCKTTCKIASP